MIGLDVQRKPVSQINADVLAFFVCQDAAIFKRQIAALKALLKESSHQFAADSFAGKEREILLLYPKGCAAKKAIVVGLGNVAHVRIEGLRRAAAVAAKHAHHAKEKVIALVEPDADVTRALEDAGRAHLWEDIGKALAEGAVLSVYRFDKYVSDRTGEDSLRKVIVVTEDTRRAKEIRKGVHLARVLCEATYFARDLQNAPGNEIYPESLARHAMTAGRRSRFRVSVLNEDRIRRLKMGGLIGVSQGSARPPRFIIMEHTPATRRGTVVLVGKGVTFDSGGISIKPAANMAEMKMDMSGAAAVIATMQAAARLRLPVRLIGLVPATENLLGGAALKPGDILTHLNGKTSEIDNTDAEGRLILADALSFAARYKPDVVIDIATLTGACVVALGHHATGMMGNDQASMDQLKAAGERTYERVWQLPMFDEYEKQVKSDIADVKNVGGRWAGAVTAAMFLKKFIGEYKWVHLDIAGTAIIEEALDYIPKGGSGVGVRLFIDFLLHWKKQS